MATLTYVAVRGGKTMGEAGEKILQQSGLINRLLSSRGFWAPDFSANVGFISAHTCSVHAARKAAEVALAYIDPPGLTPAPQAIIYNIECVAFYTRSPEVVMVLAESIHRIHATSRAVEASDRIAYYAVQNTSDRRSRDERVRRLSSFAAYLDTTR